MNTSERRNLLLVKVSIVLVLSALVVVGERIRLWPLVTWSVYSNYSPDYLNTWSIDSDYSLDTPNLSASVEQLRVITKTGDIHALHAGDLFSIDRDNVDQKLMEQAFDDANEYQEQARRALVYLIQTRFRNVEIESVEKWKLSWDGIDPLKNPPLDNTKPNDAQLLGKFSGKPYLAD